MTSIRRLKAVGRAEEPAKAPAGDPGVPREQVRALCAQNRLVMLANVVNSTILSGAMIVGGLSAAIVLPWLCLLGIALTLRARIVGTPAPDDPEAARNWLRRFTVSAASIGTVWGLAGTMLFLEPGLLVAAAITLVIAGMTAGSATTNGVHAPAATAFIAPATAPLIVYFASQGTLVHGAMAVLVGIYIFSMTRVALLNQRNLLASVHHAAEARAIADRLKIVADYSFAWEGWVDPEGKLLWVNPSVERVTGYTPEDCYAMDDYPFEIIHPDDRGLVRRQVHERRKADYGAPYQFRIVRKDGTVRWCEAESMTARDRDGNPAGYRASVRDVTESVELREELERLATTDPLTEVDNRRHFLFQCEAEVYRAKRHGRPLSVALFDLDHFKRINDAHGHGAGDECLRSFVRIVRGRIRKSDVLARFGGEEFVLMMPETPLDAAAALCDRLREAVWHEPVDCGAASVALSVSAGVTAIDVGSEDIEAVLARADEALYAAKRDGRNRVIALAPPACEADAKPEAARPGLVANG